MDGVLDIESFHPMPLKFGVGFTSPEPIELTKFGVGSENLKQVPIGFRHEHVGQYYHNYHCTKEGWLWPFEYSNDPWVAQSWKPIYVIDGFSPNLNKQLHVGHLRNLALAASLKDILWNSRFGSFYWRFVPQRTYCRRPTSISLCYQRGHSHFGRLHAQSDYVPLVGSVIIR